MQVCDALYRANVKLKVFEFGESDNIGTPPPHVNASQRSRLPNLGTTGSGCSLIVSRWSFLTISTSISTLSQALETNQGIFLGPLVARAQQHQQKTDITSVLERLSFEACLLQILSVLG